MFPECEEEGECPLKYSSCPGMAVQWLGTWVSHGMMVAGNIAVFPGGGETTPEDLVPTNLVLLRNCLGEGSCKGMVQGESHLRKDSGSTEPRDEALNQERADCSISVMFREGGL